MARLSDVCYINMGQSPSSDTYNSEHNGLPFFQGNADFGEINPKQRVWCSNPVKIAKTGDILISVRAPIGALNIADTDCCIGRGLAALTVKSDICLAKYLWYVLKFKSVELIAKGTGSTFKAINKQTLSDLEFSLPSIEIQGKIVAKIDKVVALVSRRRKQIKKLDELVKSQFIEMFGGGQYPVKKWGEVFDTTTGKLDSNAMVEGGEYPFFTCSKEVLRIDAYAYDQEALLLAGNNAAGKFDVKYYNGKFNAYQRTYILTLKDGWSYKLFKCQLENKLDYLQQQSLGGLTKYLTLKILNGLEFIVPPLALQNEFARFVEQTDKSKFRIKQSLEKLEICYKSLLQKYFG